MMMGVGRLNFPCQNLATSESGGRKLLKWIGAAVVLLILGAVIGLSVMAGGIRGAYGMVRYALPHMHRGTLRVGDVVQIYKDYKDHADFLTVYVREAHPTDEWQMKSNVKEDVCYAQPKTL